MLRFNRNDLKEEFDSGTYSRGVGYYNQGRVGKINCHNQAKDTVMVTSSVRGSYHYQQNILVEKESWGIEIEGTCDCPVGYNCKHVVSALLKYVEELLPALPAGSSSTHGKSSHLKTGAQATEARLNDWIHNFHQAEHKPSPSDLVDERKWLAYILTPSQNNAEIHVNISQSGFKMKGGYLKEKHQNFNNLVHDVRYSYGNKHINKVDFEIIKLCELLRINNYYHSEITLAGNHGWQVLKKMVASNRCFWRSMSNLPLSMGEGKRLNLTWTSSSTKGKTNFNLITTIHSDELLIFTEPSCLIAELKNEVIPLISSLNSTQLKQLITMPPIPREQLAKFNFNLIKNGLDDHLPLPVPTKIVDGSNVLIKPKILITKIEDTNGCLPALNCLEISLVYGDTEVQLFDDMLLVKQEKNQIRRIKREFDNEQLALQPLVDLEFELTRSLDKHGMPNNGMVALFAQGKRPIDTMTFWRKFLETDRWDLEQLGWQIDMAPDFHLDFIQPLDDWDVDIDQENDWFSLRFDIRLSDSDDTKTPLLPLISKLLEQYQINELPEELLIENKPGQFLVLPKAKIQPILDLMYELFDTFPQGQEVIKLSRFDALMVDHLDNNDALSIQWSGDLSIKKLAKKLANFNGIKAVSPAKSFTGKLRDYQSQGLSWLQFLREFEFAGILADDMGLGKTVQALAHIQKEKMARRLKSPCLIVAPTSLMSNWRVEAKRFTANLNVHISQGADRHDLLDDLASFDVILTTYPLIVRDFEFLSAIDFHMIILDEAQNIKNPKAKATLGLKALKAKYKLALTGTPMENHLGELWSIYDFLMPGFLGNHASFNSKYRNPIEKDNDHRVSKILSKRVAPFLLRRTKDLVASELPPKTEIIKTVSFGTAQSLLYETIRLSMEEKIQQAIATKGLNRSHITILDALLKLRQVCCDPQLVKLTQAKKIKQSAKMELLMAMLPELIEEGRKILIFSQFTSMLSIIEEAIMAENISYTKLTGSTRKRDKVIAEFTSGRADVFLISLKAGGVGLNLTEADTVIHYDPWWNPAVENQASDRAHRIGQDKPVFIYKLVVENTLEEKILEMQAKKQALADGVYGGKNARDASKLTAKDIEALLGIT